MPTQAHHFLALDLGAESGRGMLATLTGDVVELKEVHRFANEPVKLLDTLYWDAPRLFLEIKRAIREAARVCEDRGVGLSGISVDTWGLDYGLIGPSGELLGLPVHYRDTRTNGVMERAFETLPRETIFEETGLQFMQINSLYQLVAETGRGAARLQRALALLTMPDLMHYFLTGRIVTERSIASTTQLWNPRTGTWSQVLLDAFEIPRPILPEILEPGSVIGPLRPDIARELGIKTAPPVIASASHDTAAAVAAVPVSDSPLAENETWGYISSGTWSLMGIELDQPEISAKALANNFTNEGGVGGTIRFLRNIMGLWLLQESRRQWEREGTSLDYDAITELATAAPPLRSFVDPAAQEFLAPGDMPERVREFCRRTSQPIPEEHGLISRCIVESLALAYAATADRIERVTGKRIAHLHIVGGGSKNRLLNQLAANALGVPVLAGPSEATALGNALMQAVATRALASIDDLRRVVKNSTETESFSPQADRVDAWTNARQTFSKLTS
jgi:rhamnulokinase